MASSLADLTAQFNANGIKLNEIKQKGKSAIAMAYLDFAEQNIVAGGIDPLNQNFWLETGFVRNGSE